MFRGLHEHAIDAKGRTSLPARFRDALAQADGQDTRSDASLIVTTGLDRCLVAYSPTEWAAFEARLAALPQFDPAVVQLKRLYVAGATECSIDKHGRILIPPVLRAYAELQRDVVWAGMVNTIEIWAKAHWAQQMAAAREDRRGVARALAQLGL